jgi:hypothetical protein
VEEIMLAEIRDMKEPHSAIFSWDMLDPETEEGYVLVTLSYRDGVVTADGTGAGFRVTTSVQNYQIGKPLLRFLEEVGSLSGDWNGEREFLNKQRNLRITCFCCRRGEIRTEISLDADSIDAFWTVQLRMYVAQSEWPNIVKQFREFFAVTEAWE